MVTRSFLRRMRPGDSGDPLLLQVLPLCTEQEAVDGFEADPLAEHEARKAPGLLQKYAGRGAGHFDRRVCDPLPLLLSPEFPVWRRAAADGRLGTRFVQLEADSSIHEVILSGGDPLMLTDARLTEMIRRLDAIGHLDRLRIHTRLPIVLPSRVTRPLVRLLRSTRMTPIVVVHANHPAEVVDDCARTLRRLVRAESPCLTRPSCCEESTTPSRPSQLSASGSSILV